MPLTKGRNEGIIIFSHAGVAELADAPDLGSGIYDVKVQVLSPAKEERDRKVSFFFF